MEKGRFLEMIIYVKSKYFDEFFNGTKYNRLTISLFFAIVAKVQESKEKELKFDFTEIKKLVGVKYRGNRRIMQTMADLGAKIISLGNDEVNETEVNFERLFYKFNYKENNVLKVGVTPIFEDHFLFDPEKTGESYFSFDLEDLTSLETLGEQILFLKAKQFGGTGAIFAPMEDLRRWFGITPAIENNRFLRRSIMPAIEKLNEKKIIVNLEIKETKKARNKKTGKIQRLDLHYNTTKTEEEEKKRKNGGELPEDLPRVSLMNWLEN